MNNLFHILHITVVFCTKFHKDLVTWKKFIMLFDSQRFSFYSLWNHVAIWNQGSWASLGQKMARARFNRKMSSYRYRKSHCGDKMVVRSSYLHNGISYTGKMSPLYWISPRAWMSNHIPMFYMEVFTPNPQSLMLVLLILFTSKRSSWDLWLIREHVNINSLVPGDDT